MDVDEIARKERKRVLKMFEAFMRLTEDSDPRLVGILSGHPPPKELLYTRTYYYYYFKTTPSKKMKYLLATKIKLINRILDMFRPTPILLENVLKGVKTEEDEIEVIVD